MTERKRRIDRGRGRTGGLTEKHGKPDESEARRNAVGSAGGIL